MSSRRNSAKDDRLNAESLTTCKVHGSNDKYRPSPPMPSYDDFTSDVDSVHSTKTLGLSQDLAHEASYHGRDRAFSESLLSSVSGPNSPQMRSVPPQFREHRVSADVNQMVADASRKSTSRLSASLSSCKQSQASYNQPNFYNPYFAPDHFLPQMASNSYGQMNMNDKSAPYANYHMMQPFPANPPPYMNPRLGYGSACRPGCDHCVSNTAYHPFMYDGAMSGMPIHHASSYWDCGPASLPNSMFIANSALFAGGPPYLGTTSALHHSQNMPRKVTELH